MGEQDNHIILKKYAKIFLKWICGHSGNDYIIATHSK